MDIKLETKQFVEEWTGKTNTNEIFYRYNIDGNLVWFSQHQDSGNIYSTSIRLNDSSSKYFNVWVKCDDNKTFYPNGIELEMKHSHLRTEDIGRVVADIHYIDRLCDAIMSIFKMDEHYGLWCKHHRKQDGNYCELCGEYIGQGIVKVCDKCASEFKF